MKNLCATLLCCIALLVQSSCSTNGPDGGSPSEAAATEEMRSIEEGDLLAECMQERGFDFVDLRTSTPHVSFISTVRLDDADVIGYGALFDAVWLRLSNERQERETDFFSSVIEHARYYEAWSGEPGFIDETESLDDPQADPQVQSETTGSSALSSLPEGCWTKVQAELDERYTTTDDPSIAFDLYYGSLPRLESDPGYISSVNDWAECMKEAGFAPRDSPEAQNNSRLETAREVLEQDDRDDAKWAGFAVTEDVVLDRIAASPALAENLQEEIEEATTDRKCRVGYVAFVESWLSDADISY